MRVSGNGMEDTWNSWFRQFEWTDAEGSKRPLVAGVLWPDDEWKPSDADRAAALAFYVELRTRVTFERLPYRHGDEKAALESLGTLFGTARDLVQHHGAAGGHFATVVQIVLGRLRPLTSTWHRRALSGQLDRQDERRQFRLELQSKQAEFRRYVEVFARMAGVPAVGAPDAPSSRFDDGPVPPKMLGTAAGGQLSLDDVLELELQRVANRRDQVDAAAARSIGGVGVSGLAISGGGIRSATFSLGVLQSLARHGVVDAVDYLSTVSGGGYIGSFLSAHLVGKRWSARDLLVGSSAGNAGPDPAPVRELRNDSKYLISRGRKALGRAVLRAAQGPLVVAAALIVGFVAFFLLEPDGVAWWLSSAILLALVVLMFRNANATSFRPYYRDRLAATYAKRPSIGRVPKLSECGDEAPYHLLVAAVNLPGSESPELRGRRSDFFVFSPEACGSVLTGYGPTNKLEARDQELDLGTAMAISGAAISTHLGTLRRPLLRRPLLHLARLGYWLPNPRYAHRRRDRWQTRGIVAFAREVWNRFDEKGRHVNVSDGGHIENLGVYELLRRRCKLIVCIDGEEDPSLTCGSLIKACRYAWIDLGVNVRIDLDELQLDDTGHTQAHFALGTIDYGAGDGHGHQVGYLLYIKLSVTGNERDYVREYRDRHPAFPHQPTSDQLFDEDQFEAYRALGEHVGDDLFREELIGEAAGEIRILDWFKRLVTALEPELPDSVRSSR